MRRGDSNVALKILGYFVMLFVILISVVPFFWTLISSFKTNNEILSSAFSVPTHFSMVAYVQAITITKLQLRFFTSLFVCSLSTVVGLVIYAMGGYVIARFSFRFKEIIFVLLISSLLVPTDAMIQPIYIVIRMLGLYDTKFALVLVYTGFALPICLFLLRSFFANIPNEMEEAAYLEGAGFYKTFSRIMLPLAQPALMSSAVLSFLGSWNELLFALLLTSSEKNRTLPLALKYFVSTFNFNYPPMFAAMVMYMLPSILIYVVLQEQVMKSLIAGAVKG